MTIAMNWTDYISSIENSNWRDCFQAADWAGYTKDEAEMCDDNDLDCPFCPFKEEVDSLNSHFGAH